MLYKVKATLKKDTLKAFFTALADGSIQALEPDGSTMVKAMQEAKMVDGDIIWYEECYCAIPLKHEREIVFDNYLTDFETTLVDHKEDDIVGDLFSNYHRAKELFKNASSDQYIKLANMVYAYASNIDKLENLQKGIDKVAQIHVDTKILPEHYPWVGESLLKAIKEVLGDAATEEVMDAWAKAYGFLSTVFIAKEEALYAAS